MTIKQKLVLFLISCDPGIRDIYTMVKVYDRADFPSNIGEHLKVLKDKDFIIITHKFEDGTANKYGITENGKKYLTENFNTEKVINCIKAMDNPDQLLSILLAYISKQNSK